MQFQIKGQDYFLAFVEQEKRWYVIAPKPEGVHRIPVYVDAVTHERGFGYQYISVVLSAVRTSRSEVLAESKDPWVCVTMKLERHSRDDSLCGETSLSGRCER